jgi:phosphate/sulfate permease
MSEPTPQTDGKRSCNPPPIPWYILVPLVIVVSAMIAYKTSKDTVIELRDKVKENIKDKKEKRIQQRKATEKEMLIAAYDDENML